MAEVVGSSPTSSIRSCEGSRAVRAAGTDVHVRAARKRGAARRAASAKTVSIASDAGVA